MANEVKKVNTIAIADIEAINTITDDNLQALNTLEFSGTPADAHVLIATATSDGSDASLGFIDGTNGVVFDNTYDVYEFVFTNMHPETDGQDFKFQVNASGGSGFNETITSTNFRAAHDEADSATTLTYNTADDQAQGTSYQSIGNYVGSDNDQSTSGILTLYAPSSTTYVKHFMARSSDYMAHDQAGDYFIAGYINTTSAIDEIDFKFASDEIQGGEIKMYGLAKS